MYQLIIIVNVTQTAIVFVTRDDTLRISLSMRYDMYHMLLFIIEMPLHLKCDYICAPSHVAWTQAQSLFMIMLIMNLRKIFCLSLF